MTPPVRTRPRIAAEHGFTLMELMVGTTIAMVVFLAAVNFLGVAQRSQTSTGNRAEALGQQRVGLERITRELRQAHTAQATGGPVLDFELPASDSAPAIDVRYDCATGGVCRRYETPDGQPFPSGYQEVVTDVVGAAFTASGQYVSIDLQVGLPEREIPIVLSDGVHLRNEPDA